MNGAGSASAGSSLWFARHEAQLIWRDFVSMMTAGRPGKVVIMAAVLALVVAVLHALAFWLMAPLVGEGIAAGPATWLVVGGAMAMFFSLMVSQSIESVTRAYYARSDLDLILSSPVNARRLFEVRSLVLAAQSVLLSTLIAMPAINALAVLDGSHWLAAYPVIFALGLLSTACAIGLTLFLFRTVGAKRTRLIAQILAAVVGAGFVIALQGFAILLGKGFSRFALFVSQDSVAALPGADSGVWIVPRAAMGEIWPLVAIFAFCALALLFAVIVSGRRFASDVLATAGLVERKSAARAFAGFKGRRSVRATLRAKEWRLLARDPWLMSQSLQQILYLLPPALLLWMNIGENNSVLFVVVPVIVMAVGQLAGGLAWITISGEDAHELIETAPVTQATILRAKIEAVVLIIGAILAPFALAVALVSPRAAIMLMVGGAAAAACAVAVQLWFRAQMKRSLFRRRQVSSRIATLCEAFISILCAAAAGLAIWAVPLIVIPGVPLLVVLAFAYWMRPRREEG